MNEGVAKLHNYILQALLCRGLPDEPAFTPPPHLEALQQKQLQQLLAWMDSVRTKDSSGPFPVTQQEWQWLKQAVADPSAADYLSPSLLAHLRDALASHPDVFLHTEERGTLAATPPPPHLWHSLKQAIRSSAILQISYRTNRGSYFAHVPGWPWKLEYSQPRGEWHLVWLRTDQTQRVLLRTPLRHIDDIAPDSSVSDPTSLEQDALTQDQAANCHASLEMPAAYRMEYPRILSRLSWFDREVEEDEEGSCRIHLRYTVNEEAYLLSLIRQLGCRIIIRSPESLRDKLLESVRKVLNRYTAIDQHSQP